MENYTSLFQSFQNYYTDTAYRQPVSELYKFVKFWENKFSDPG